MTKTDVVDEICQAIGLPQTLPLSTGSTEPRQLFAEIDDAFGLGLSSVDATKPELAAAIVQASGQPWLPQYESRGGTVTLRGLIAVRDAVRFFLGERVER